MHRKKLVGGNWKSNGTVSATKAFAGSFPKEPDFQQKINLFIAPPFTSLHCAASGQYELGAQDVFYENGGPYTGAIRYFLN